MTALRPFQPGIWLTELELGDFDVRGAVLVGNRRAAVWDTLSHPRDMQPVRDLVAGLPLTVIYSHADWDHAWGTGGLSAEEIIGHSDSLGRFAADVPLTLERKRAAEPEQWADVRLLPPTRTFQSVDRIDLGDLTVEMHHLPGHTLDGCVGFIPERGVLLIGDCVETPLPVVNGSSPLETWIAGLAAWAADERVQTVIPSHGPIGGREIISRNVDYLTALATGATMDVPAGMADFYRRTHANNQRIVRERSH